MFLPRRSPACLVPGLVPCLPRRLPPAPSLGSAFHASTTPAFLRFRKALSKLHTDVRPRPVPRPALRTLTLNLLRYPATSLYAPCKSPSVIGRRPLSDVLPGSLYSLCILAMVMRG